MKKIVHISGRQQIQGGYDDRHKESWPTDTSAISFRVRWRSTCLPEANVLAKWLSLTSGLEALAILAERKDTPKIPTNNQMILCIHFTPLNYWAEQ